MHQQPVILFDGVCNLCNNTVKFIIKRDKKAYFSFASLQSGKGQKLLEKYHLSHYDLSSFILLENGKAFSKSTGALQVVRKLDGLWPLLYCFILIPKFIRDKVYETVANNRYKWFGKKDECLVLTPQLKARIIN